MFEHELLIVRLLELPILFCLHGCQNDRS